MERIFAALSLMFALVFAQIPEVVQQYRQRIGGAADELTVIVAISTKTPAGQVTTAPEPSI